MNSQMKDPQVIASHEVTHLRRVLGFWELVFYGIVLIQPIAALGLFGIASKVSGAIWSQPF